MPKKSKAAKIAAAKKKLKQFKQNKEKKPEAKAEESSKPVVEVEKTVDNQQCEEDKKVSKEEDVVNHDTSIVSSETNNNQDTNDEVLEASAVDLTQNADQQITETASEKQITNGTTHEQIHDNSAEIKQDIDVPQPEITTKTQRIENNNNNHIVTSQHQEDVIEESKPANKTSINSSTSTTELMIQMSGKLHDMVGENPQVGELQPSKSLTNQLEERNQELVESVTSLEEEKIQLKKQLEIFQHQISQLQATTKKEKEQIYTASMKEQTAYQQQLQVQMHTIGVLVAEKQELQHQLNENKIAAKRNANQRQTYQDELKESKLQLQTMERDSKNKAAQISALQKLQNELKEEKDDLNRTVNNLKGVLEEHQLHSGELTQKLISKEQKCQQLNNELNQMNDKLSMAEVLLQQLSNGGGGGSPDNNQSAISNNTELEQLRDERESLNQKLVEYQQAFEQLTGEREQLSRQYEDVNEQMKKQVTQLINQVEILEREKTELIETQNELNAKISTIEVKAGNSDENKTNEATSSLEQAESENYLQKIADLEEALSKLAQEKENINKQLEIQLQNNQHLSRMNEEKEQEIMNLGNNITEQSVSLEEHSRLVEQSHNDRTALSRALIQNKQLKTQLEELQEYAVTLNNSKLELTDQISTLQYNEKELTQQLHIIKEEKMEQKDAVETEGSRHLAESLKQAEESCSLISEENAQLKLMIARLQQELDESSRRIIKESTQQQNEESSTDITIESNQIESTVESSSEQTEESTNPVETGSDDDVITTSDDVTMSSGENSTQLRSLMETNQQLNTKLAELQAQVEEERKINESNRTQEHEKYQEMEKNMSLLQERFSTMMRERADAMNRIEDLEHINLQLQNECDTIGEYITLYHNQRKALQQRHHEKDDIISMLNQERDNMQEKLEQLQLMLMQRMDHDKSINAAVPEGGDQIEDAKPESDVTKTGNGGDEDAVTSQRPDLLPPRSEDQKSPPTPETEVAMTTSVGGGSTLPGKLRKVTSQPEANTSVVPDDDKIMDLIDEMKAEPKRRRGRGNNLTDHLLPPPRGFLTRYTGRYTSI